MTPLQNLTLCGMFIPPLSIGGRTCMLVFLTGAVKYFYSRKFGINLFSEITPSYLDYNIFLYISSWKKFKSGGALISRELGSFK